MKVKVNGAALAAAVSAATRAATTRSGIAVLGALRLDADAGRLRVSGTDLELTVSVTVDAKVVSPGSCLLGEAKTVQKTIALLGGTLGVVELYDEQDALVAVDHEGTYRLPSGWVYDFPKLAEPKPVATLPAGPLAELFDYVLPAVSKDDSRPVLTCMHLQIQKGRVHGVGTDSYRMAVCERPAEVGWLRPRTATVKGLLLGRAATELRRWLKDPDEQVVVLADGKTLGFRLERPATGTTIELVARMVEGKYPDWKELRPKETTTEVRMPGPPLVSLLAKVRPLLAGPTPVELRFAADGEVQVVAGTTSATLTKKATVKGDPVEIGFSPDWLSQAVASSGDRVTIKLAGPIRPAVFTNGKAGARTWHMLMPIRLAGREDAR